MGTRRNYFCSVILKDRHTSREEMFRNCRKSVYMNLQVAICVKHRLGVSIKRTATHGARSDRQEAAAQTGNQKIKADRLALQLIK